MMSNYLICLYPGTVHGVHMYISDQCTCIYRTNVHVYIGPMYMYCLHVFEQWININMSLLVLPVVQSSLIFDQ